MPEAVVIKKEDFDPFTASAIFFDNEINKGSESSDENNDDDEEYSIVSYEPEAKKRKKTKSGIKVKGILDCKHCGRKFSTQSHLTKHVR